MGRKGDKGKSVRFSKEPILHLLEDVELLENEIWYFADEYATMKARGRSEAKEWRRSGYSQLLKETFETPRSDAQDFINAFCMLEDEFHRRGLERQLSRQHGEERSDLKERAKQSVLSNQERLKGQGLRAEELVDHLAHIYKDVTRAAKVFARRLGKADELVVQRGANNTPAHQIIDQLERQQRHSKAERRLSNFSMASMRSGNSDISRRLIPTPGRKANCPSSPASAMEEYYAAIA